MIALRATRPSILIDWDWEALFFHSEDWILYPWLCLALCFGKNEGRVAHDIASIE